MQGFVEQIGEKSGSKNGRAWTIYSIKVNGDWLGAGFDRPSCKEGDSITYDIEQSGQYQNIANMVVGAAQAQPQQQTSSAPSSGSARVDTRDISIRYQSCRKDALLLTQILLANEALKLPAKASDKVDAAMAFVEDVTAQYYVKLQGVMDNGGIELEDTIPAPDNN